MADNNSRSNGNNTSILDAQKTDVRTGALFLAGMTLASIIGGFGFAIGQARRRSPGAFDERQQEGVKLALRALGWGTVLSVSGVGILVIGVKTALGVKDVRKQVYISFCFLQMQVQNRCCVQSYVGISLPGGGGGAVL